MTRRPASVAPSDIINADTIPPTKGGIATMTVSKSKMKVPIANNMTIIPKIPEREMTMVFH